MPNQELQGSPLDYAINRQTRLTMPAVRAAVERGSGLLAYQPVVRSGEARDVAFYEGLIRIVDDAGRIVPLKDFMPVAEKSEFGRQIDCLSLSLGLKALTEIPGLRLAVNMSARSISYPDWISILRRGVKNNPMVGERLILEITESSAMERPEQVNAFISEAQKYGISIALDDFGADYTSFRYLRDFCFDMVKIDGQFIRSIARQPDNQALIGALQSVAQHFDMFTVAESVETAEDAAFLNKMGIDCMQGYYFGAPTITPPWRVSPAAVRH